MDMTFEPRTHEAISAALCGQPVDLRPGQARVALTLTPAMTADDRGLVHGGFTFGLADYAAMLAVNEPTVVLASAETKFLGPVVVGDTVEAVAVVERIEGKKRWVTVVVHRGDAVVMQGTFLAVVPERQILDGQRA